MWAVKDAVRAITASVWAVTCSMWAVRDAVWAATSSNKTGNQDRERTWGTKTKSGEQRIIKDKEG